MTKIGKLSLVLMALTFTLSVALPPAASAKLVRKVDNLLVLIDTSGSMSEGYADTQQKKIDAAVDIVTRFDQAVPELGYTTGVYTVAPFEEVAPLQTYQNGLLSSAAGEVDTGFGLLGGLSYIGRGLSGAGEVIESGLEAGEEKMPLPGKTAIVLLTDGDWNAGFDPAVVAKDLYDKHGDNICIHAVSLADSSHGQMAIDSITGLSNCSASADVNSLSTKAGMAAFAQKVLYGEVAAAAPVPAPVVVAKEVITFNLLFGFDKADISDDMIPVLEQVQMILEEDPEAAFIVAGHTDSVGSEDYNQGLSQRRASAVGNWLTSNGVAADRLDMVGYGENQPKFDNMTEDGRKLNRRVEIVTK
jgi:OmpA-OmpF porin, OOP family